MVSLFLVLTTLSFIFCLFLSISFFIHYSIEATAKDPITGKRYFQPTVFAAPKHQSFPVFPHKTQDPDSISVDIRVEEKKQNNYNHSSHVKESEPSVIVPSSSSSSSTLSSTCASVSKSIGRSVSTDGSTGVPSRVRRTPEEVCRALTNTPSAHRDSQRSSQLQVELQPQHEVFMCTSNYVWACVLLCVFVHIYMCVCVCRHSVLKFSFQQPPLWRARTPTFLIILHICTYRK